MLYSNLKIEREFKDLRLVLFTGVQRIRSRDSTSGEPGSPMPPPRHPIDEPTTPQGPPPGPIPMGYVPTVPSGKY